MCYTISIILNLKSLINITHTEDLIYDAGNNCKSTNIFSDFNLEGVNNYIKTNNKIIILEFDLIENLISFIKFIILIREIKIETIYQDNNILYAEKKYINTLDKSLHDKDELQKIININKNKVEFKELYNLIKF